MEIVAPWAITTELLRRLTGIKLREFLAQHSTRCERSRPCLPSHPGAFHADSFLCMSSWCGSLVLGGCLVHRWGSLADWECQEFNDPGVTPTSVGLELVDTYPSLLMPQWDNPKMYSTQSLKGPQWDGASVAPSGSLVINVFFIVKNTVMFCFLFHSPTRSVFPWVTSQVNYASKSLGCTSRETTGHGCLCYMRAVGVKMRKHFESNILSPCTCRFLLYRTICHCSSVSDTYRESSMQTATGWLQQER